VFVVQTTSGSFSPPQDEIRPIAQKRRALNT
jgi:hypothetical protein